MKTDKFNSEIEDVFNKIIRSRTTFKPELQSRESGIVKNVSSGIATVNGLPGAWSEELLKFSENLYGIAFNLEAGEIGCVLLGDGSRLKAGDTVERTHRITDIPVGNELIGRVLNPLGEVMDDKGPLFTSKRFPIERPAPPIMDREAVNIPLQTGIKVIDALVPIGRGQRELILGDRQTGKTSIAIDTICNQHDQNVLCVYCAIGQGASSLAKVIARLTEKGVMDYTTVVATEGNDSPGLQYIAPYAATSIAEFFMEQGRDVLIVYDDLTNHARAYRELSLLLRRPPGREAYPGDIFYIHSRLLERATHLNSQRGGGSLTALPIIETEAEDISSYIPTNLISITDGQIYLSPRLFDLGFMPAVDVTKSVSRVGGKAQLPVYKNISGNLKLTFSQFEELESFARFGTRLDANTKAILEHGKRIRACFRQPELQPVSVPEQVMVLLSLTNGLLDEIDLEDISGAENILYQLVPKLPSDLGKYLEGKSQQDTEKEKAILRLAKNALLPLTDQRNSKTKNHE